VEAVNAVSRMQDVGEKAACQAGQHHGAPAEFVEERGPIDGAHHAEDWVDGVDEELFVGVEDAGFFDHFGLLGYLLALCLFC
jgi:hypothetical protein